MIDLAAALSREQTLLLRTMAQQYLMEGQWPAWQFTVDTLDRHDLDAEELIRSLPRVGSSGQVGPSYGLTTHTSFHISDDDRPALTIASALHVPELQPYVAAPFLSVLHVLIAIQRSAPLSTQKAARPRFTLADIERELPKLPKNFLAWLPDILTHEPATWGGSSGTEHDAWWRELSREIRQYRDATTLHEYVHTTARLITAQAEALSAPHPVVPAPAPAPAAGPYVAEDLLAELEAKDTAFRTDKLLALARELNANYADENPYACQMLLRAILDHIPPIFGQKNFQHVVAHGPWGKTEKVYMKQLREFRASADDALHRQIGTRTSRFSIGDLPTRASVNALLEGVLDHLPVIQQQEA
ncbi:hypothetical protein WDH52_17205 [Streptomyces sp. TRM70308]|uniref:hypothetical protein n=1 Tax=Streptomyces sp. TRM70308 TaxID=3131932 RepID=UPI003CFC103E